MRCVNVDESQPDIVAPIDIAIDHVRQVYGGWRRDTPVEKMREDWDRLFWSERVPAATRTVSLGRIEGLWVRAHGVDSIADASVPVVLYFHGGGFKVGSVRSHRDLMARLSAAARCQVLGVEYRLAPEDSCPAPIEDAVAAHEWLLAQGIAARHIAFAGDSAGGGIVASAIMTLRQRGTPLPAAGIMLSAWTDLTAAGESYVSRAAADPIHQRPMILSTARTYLAGNIDPSDPVASPLFGDLTGFPPLLLQVGGRETVLDDSTRFAAKARAAGVAVELEVYENMIHVFQQFPDLLPEAREAIESIGRFLSKTFSVGVQDAGS